MNEWFVAHPYWTYVIIFMMVAYVYEMVFRVQRLSVIKRFIVYVVIGAGSLMLSIMQWFQFPIVFCLGIAITLMWITGVRVHLTKRMQAATNEEVVRTKETEASTKKN